MSTRTRRRVLSADLLERERVGGFGRSVPFASDVYPHAFHISPWMSWSASSGSTPARAASTSAVGLGYLQNPPAADADSVSWSLRLAAGVWSVKIVYVTVLDAGIINWKMNGATVATLDEYSAGTVWNVVSTTTGVAVASSGIQTLAAVVNSKHASSIDFRNYVVSLSGVRTGA